MNKEEMLKHWNPPEQRWSGLESDAMKLQGCSLLTPRDVWYEAGPYNLAPQRMQTGVDQFVDFPGGQPVRIVAHSKKCGSYDCETGDSKKDDDGETIMPLFMVIAGKVRFTEEDKQLFTFTMMNKEDAKRMRLPVNNNKLDWPDVRALMLCPICATTQQPGKEYWMVLHTLQQVQMDSFLFATRQIPRLMCLDCFESLWPLMVRDGGGIRQEQALTVNPGFPVAGFPAPRGIQSAGDNFNVWECSGMYAAVDLKFRKQSMSGLDSMLQGGGVAQIGNLYDKKDPRIDDASPEACVHCRNIKEGGNHTCSQCKLAKYCSRGEWWSSAKPCIVVDIVFHSISPCLFSCIPRMSKD